MLNALLGKCNLSNIHYGGIDQTIQSSISLLRGLLLRSFIAVIESSVAQRFEGEIHLSTPYAKPTSDQPVVSSTPSPRVKPALSIKSISFAYLIIHPLSEETGRCYIEEYKDNILFRMRTTQSPDLYPMSDPNRFELEF